MSKPEWRKPYNFRSEVRHEQRRQQHGRCFVEGCECKHGLQLHHILPAKVAYDKYPDLDPQAVRSLENAIYLCEAHHVQLHKELAGKPTRKRLAYYRAMYEHLLETMAKAGVARKQKAMAFAGSYKKAGSVRIS